MPSNIDKISDLGEKKLIKRLLSKSQNPQIKSLFLDELSIKSFSDDAALIDIGKNYLVTCSDMLMAYTHFPDEMSPYQIGQKVVTVNVSDLAAMGAGAIGILISMGLPRNMKLLEFDQIIDGILDACKKYNMSLIGGDTNESKELTLCGTCLGIVKKEVVMMKHGAQVGDVLAVTGPLGLAAAGFKVLINGSHKFNNLDIGTKDLVIKHALEPEAKLDTGVILANSGSVTSATDITDGLLSELGEMMDACKDDIGIVLNQEDLPIPKVVFDIAHISSDNPIEMALTYGEDFELVLTVKPDQFEDLKSRINLHKIGFVDSSAKIKMIDKEGNTNIITPKGYDHLK
ncbi:MAG: thiamine-phosphate kinase [Methanobacterium sp.]